MDRRLNDRKRKRVRHDRMYCVVLFTNEKDSVGAVPVCWLSKSTTRCMWPPKGTGPHAVDQMARNRLKPGPDWQRCPCRVLGYADTYADAKIKMKIAEQTSHTESANSSEDFSSPKRHVPDIQLRMPGVEDAHTTSIAELADLTEYAQESCAEVLSAGSPRDQASPMSVANIPSSEVRHETVRDVMRTMDVPSAHSLRDASDDLLGRHCEDPRCVANQRMLHRVVQLLMEVRADIKELKGNYATAYSEGPCQEIGPATSVEVLKEIEEELADPDKRTFLTKKLGLIGGTTPDEATRLIMKAFIKTPVALEYTLEVRRYKPAFKDLRLYNVIVAAVQRRIPHADVAVINNRIGGYLRGVRDRHGGRRARMK